MDVVIASNNAHKIKEIKEILANKFENLYSLREANINCDPDENGTTFLENAQIKAREIAKHTNCAVLSDDTGLCVHALGNEPGIFSARYAGEQGNDKPNRDKLLANLLDKQDRTAHFETVVVLHYPDGSEVVGVGRVDGHILCKETGSAGFGYDCIFYCDDLNKSFGLATDDEKNSVSHRGRALRNLLTKL